LPALLDLLNCTSPHNQRAAAEALGRMRDRKAVAALLAVNPADDVAFRRATQTPVRGIGPATLARLDEARAGRYVRQASGYRAFMPAPLPPRPPVRIEGDVQARLDAAARLHRTLESASHPDSFAIGARHLPTVSRCIVSGGRGTFPPCDPRSDDPRLEFAFEPGDSSVSERSLGAAPGLDPSRIWFVHIDQHRALPAHPEVHRLILEALLATDRAIPLTLLGRKTTRALPVAGPAC